MQFCGQLRFNLEALNFSDEDPIWEFKNQDLSNFTFSGDLCQKSVFINCNLRNADLSQMSMLRAAFIGNIILEGTKFPNNILNADVLDEHSKHLVIQQLATTYTREAGVLSLNRFAFFNANDDIILNLRNRAERNASGASARTLRIHGLS